MRQVTYDIMQAFINHDRLSKSNSFTDGSIVYLHGNAIVKRENNEIYISDAGWQSNTTKERLNGLLELVGDNRRVYQKNYTWFLGDDTWCDLEDDNGWVLVK